MKAFVSTLTSKSQTVIPKAIRLQMGLNPGDHIRYSMRGGRVEIEKVKEAAEESINPFAAFNEWASSQDRSAFAHLKPKR